MGSTKAWRYCVVGNITKSHVDDKGILRYGTAAYVGGTKVYLCGKYWEPEWGHIAALGLNRFKLYQVNAVSPELIENVRVSKAYKPSVLKLMGDIEFDDCWWKNTPEDRKEVEEFVREWNRLFNK